MWGGPVVFLARRCQVEALRGDKDPASKRQWLVCSSIIEATIFKNLGSSKGPSMTRRYTKTVTENDAFVREVIYAPTEQNDTGLLTAVLKERALSLSLIHI